MFVFLVLAGVSGCGDSPGDSPTEPAPDRVSEVPESDISEGEAAGAPTVPFAEAEVFFERNLTDNDLGLQLFLDAEGWRRVDVFDPGDRKIVRILGRGPLSGLGITELRFESAEPTPAEVLALFPPGEYEFTGTTVENRLLVGTAELSHEFVPAFRFSPDDGDVVDPTDLTVRWNAPGAESVEVIIESEESENVFDVIVGRERGRLDVPPQFLEPGLEYKLELLAYHENGNRTILEHDFETQD